MKVALSSKFLIRLIAVFVLNRHNGAASCYGGQVCAAHVLQKQQRSPLS
jgi:hypothetical protein